MKIHKLSFLFIVVSLLTLFACGKKVEKTNNDMLTVNSKDNLLSILKQFNGTNGGIAFDNMTPESASKDSTDNSQGRDYSKTNTQVNGVDEADVVKTDGTNIYLIRQNQVVISQVYPVTETNVSTIDYKDTGFFPNMLFVDDEYLVVIGYYYQINNQPEDKSASKPEVGIGCYYCFHKSMTKVYVYNKGNYTNPINELNLDGYLLNTRKINNELILVTNQYINYWQLEDENYDARPQYRINDKEYTIDYNEIHYKEGTYPYGFVTVMKFDISSTNDTAKHYTYMGSGDNLYISENSLYVTQRQYYFRTTGLLDKADATYEMKDTTLVTKIPLNTDVIKATKTIEVRGHINNQFSLDEYNGNFRIVTTHGNTWDNTAENNLYIYDNDLNQLSKIEGIAKGEQIQSARFVGDRIYIVTFRTIDPFFVIDAKDPNNPKLLGELKVPGYSTYLHPYDVNNIIGFGFETDTIREDNREFTRIIGLKMSLFNVTDPTNPTSKDPEIIYFGDSGYSYSELNYNHKALLFNKNKNLIAFPITTSSYKKILVNENGKTYETYQYFYKQSYKVYNITLDGFTYKTDISHFTTEKNDYYRYGYEVMRGLYIEDYLYTVSMAKIQVHSLKDFKLVKEIDLNFNEQQYYHYWYGERVID